MKFLEQVGMFTLPLPPKALGGNERTSHWGQKRRRNGPAATCRQMAEAAARGALGIAKGNDLRTRFHEEPSLVLVLQIHAFPARQGLGGGLYCAADSDNGRTAFKAYQDGIAAAVGINDRRFDSFYRRMHLKGHFPLGPFGGLLVFLEIWEDDLPR